MPWPVVMREFDRLRQAEQPPATGNLSPPLDPEDSLFWPAVFDAVYNAPNGLGSHERLPATRAGYGDYLFRLKL